MNLYGNITYAGSQWLIAGEPFVKTRLKRLFPRAPQQAADVIRISATPENTRDLQWFLQRYPMQVDRPDMMEKLSAQHLAIENRLADLMAGREKPSSITLAAPPSTVSGVRCSHAGSKRRLSSC